MKRKKTLSPGGLLTVIMSVMMLASCNDLKNAFSSGVDLTNPEETAKLNEMLNRHITPDMLVHEIRFDHSQSNSGFSFHKDNATIIYVDPDNKTFQHGISIDLKTGEYGPDSWLEKSNGRQRITLKGVKIGQFDFSGIAGIVNAAVEAMKAEEINPDGLGSFSISFSSGNIDKYKYSFSLQHRTGSTRQGRSTRISYDSYNFTADKDGNLTAK
jgi:hypothetical protein